MHGSYFPPPFPPHTLPATCTRKEEKERKFGHCTTHFALPAYLLPACNLPPSCLLCHLPLPSLPLLPPPHCCLCNALTTPHRDTRRRQTRGVHQTNAAADNARGLALPRSRCHRDRAHRNTCYHVSAALPPFSLWRISCLLLFATRRAVLLPPVLCPAARIHLRLFLCWILAASRASRARCRIDSEHRQMGDSGSLDRRISLRYYRIVCDIAVTRTRVNNRFCRSYSRRMRVVTVACRGICRA